MVHYDGDHWFGPLKISIRDECLMDHFQSDFLQIKKYIPKIQSFKDVWAIYNAEGQEIYVDEKQDVHFREIMEKIIDLENEQLP
jgi:hypothetical protein